MRHLNSRSKNKYFVTDLSTLNSIGTDYVTRVSKQTSFEQAASENVQKESRQNRTTKNRSFKAKRTFIVLVFRLSVEWIELFNQKAIDLKPSRLFILRAILPLYENNCICKSLVSG